MADPNLTLKDVVDYVVQIRAQDIEIFHLIFTIFAGSILVVILAAFLKGGEKKQIKHSRWETIIGCFAFLFFIALIAFLINKHNIRKEFPLEWMADNIVSVKKAPVELIKDFSDQRFAFVSPSDPNHTLESKYEPTGLIKKYIRGEIVSIVFELGCPGAAIVFCCIAIYLRSRAQPHDETQQQGQTPEVRPKPNSKKTNTTTNVQTHQPPAHHPNG